MSSAAVLLIEDDELIGEGLNLGLAARQISVHWVRTASAAWRAIEQFSAEVIVLDLGLPDADGMHVLKRLRESGNSVPGTSLTDRYSGGKNGKHLSGRVRTVIESTYSLSSEEVEFEYHPNRSWRWVHGAAIIASQ